MTLFSLSRLLLVVCGLGLSLGTGTLLGFDPVLNTVLPRAGQQGQSVPVTLRGDRLYEPQEIVFYRQGITVQDLKKEDDKRTQATFVIGPEAEPGEYPFRLRTKGGVSYLRTFWVTQLPIVAELSTRDEKRKRTSEANDSFDSPQAVEMNTVIAGVARNENADYYLIDGKKGQRVSAEVIGMRLGQTAFDPYLAILDSKRFELATCDDSVLAKRDPFLSLILPEDGQYTILVRESSYQGSDEANYLLQISDSPRATSLHPPVANPGQKLKVTFRGDAAGDITQELTTPQQGSEVLLFAKTGERLAASPNPLRLSSLPIHPEREPNNQANVVTKGGPAAPVPSTLHGVLDEQGDHDWFRFTAKKGQVIRAQVHARSLRSPIDTVVQIRPAKDAKGAIANDDDGTNPDSKVDFPIPADGDYLLQIRDHLNRGGPDFTYTIDLTERPITLSAELPYAANNDSQKNRAIVIPRGNRILVVPNVARQNTGCDVTVTHDQLPKGVSLAVKNAPRDPVGLPILFSAAQDAPLAARLTRFQIKDPKSALTGPFHENIHHVEINNAGPFCSTHSDRLTVAVVEEAPFELAILSPPVPLVRNGTMELRVRAKRAEGYPSPIKITLPWRPPGVGAPPEVTIPEGKSEISIPINANGEASIRKWPIAVTGEASTDRGKVRVSSPFVTLELAEPYLHGSIDLVTTEVGKNITLTCALENLRPFDGEAEFTLQGLPHKVTAKPVKFTAQDTEIKVPLIVPADVKPGKNKNIFAQVLITESKNPVPHQIAQGTTLIITPKPKADLPQNAAKAGTTP